MTTHAVVRLNPGLYVFRDGPWSVGSGAELTGDGVTLAFAGKGATLELQSGADVRLAAPGAGDFARLALFSESTSPDVEWMIVSSGATLDIVGTMYLPTHEIWLKSPATDAAILTARTTSYGLIAKRFWVQGRADLEVTHTDPEAEDALRLRADTRLVR